MLSSIDIRRYKLIAAQPQSRVAGAASGSLATSSCPPVAFLVISLVRGYQMTEESLRRELSEAIYALGYKAHLFLPHVLLPPNGCWIWTGRTGCGYGLFSTTRAHRICYEAVIGPIPEDLVPDHLCRTRNCIHPLHIEPKTNRENILLGIGPSAKNARKTHCIRGHKLVPINVLTDNGHGRHCRQCKRDRNNTARRIKRLKGKQE